MIHDKYKSHEFFDVLQLQELGPSDLGSSLSITTHNVQQDVIDNQGKASAQYWASRHLVIYPS